LDLLYELFINAGTCITWRQY